MLYCPFQSAKLTPRRVKYYYIRGQGVPVPPHRPHQAIHLRVNSTYKPRFAHFIESCVETSSVPQLNKLLRHMANQAFRQSQTNS